VFATNIEALNHPREEDLFVPSAGRKVLSSWLYFDHKVSVSLASQDGMAWMSWGAVRSNIMTA
jgi:hypothetical protein